MLNHCLNSITKSALESCIRSTKHNPDLSRSATTANIACIHSDAGRLSTVMLMHLLAIH